MSTVNPVKYHNTKLLTKEQLKDIKDFVSWVMNKFFKTKRQIKMTIDINFDDKLEAKKGLVGSCIWEDTHYRPNEFTIEVDTTHPFKNVLNTVAHEMAHVKQWAYGYFYEPIQPNAKRKAGKKIYKFGGKMVDTAKINYLDYPWEIEATGLSVTLVLQWCTATGRQPQDYMLVC